jgi:hypothetical protein
MTFADGVLKLVRAGARIELRDDAPVRAAMSRATRPAEAQDEFEAEFEAELEGEFDADMDELAGAALLVAHEPQMAEPGLGDLEAAVAMVEAGVASRVILSGFPSWPGLLWRAYQLAEANNVNILPTVVRPGGLVDIVITRDFGADV